MKNCVLFLLLSISCNAFADNLPYLQAKKAGIKKCLPAIQKISEFLVKDAKIGTHSRWSRNSPDTSAFSTVIEANVSDGTILMNLNVTPTLGGNCYIEYESIFHFNKSCLAASQSLKDAKYVGELNKEIAVLSQGNVDTYLIPNGNECTMVRKEVIMDANLLFADNKSDLSDADFSQLVFTLLTHKQIAMYLHPEVPGRVPVKVHFTGAYKDRPVKIALYNKPVQVVSKSKDVQEAVQLTFKCANKNCDVSIEYKREGIWGSAKLSMQGGKWKVNDIQILE